MINNLRLQNVRKTFYIFKLNISVDDLPFEKAANTKIQNEMDNWWLPSPQKRPKLIQLAFILDDSRKQFEDLLECFIVPLEIRVDFFLTAKSHKRVDDQNKTR